ncbi:DNA-processing protein DprA [Collinsella sp. AGMB00827]|uniref:DNA-processing protein DprA n=1 Tax=Collinsella ureilytica TaxID=2869515 RepID=A0ABS7MKZ4_9ACTN|nr:DNA-processing protein DprA [Collinsella urealyticum]
MEAAVDEQSYEIYTNDPHYPASLTELSDAPPVLYVRGNLEALKRPGLSIVGARGATPYGRAIAEMAARVAAESGIAVISGGARGCDAAAGAEAIEAGGTHIAVLGCGADVVYPKSSRRLLEQTIVSGGALVSLDPWGTPPRRWAFPRRNRVIAALGLALLVTEAGIPSGTFSTAEAALELGRELLAVPGSILSNSSRGSNRLIAEGAVCIADEEALEVAISRIFGVLRPGRLAIQQREDMSEAERHLMTALVASPITIEAIGRLLNLDGQAALILVSSLLSRGLVERLVDGRISASAATLHALSSVGHHTTC